MTLRSPQLLTEMSIRNISWRVKATGAYSWQPYQLHVPNVLKSGCFNLLEPSGSVQACNGIDLPLPLPLSMFKLFNSSVHCTVHLHLKKIKLQCASQKFTDWPRGAITVLMQLCSTRYRSSRLLRISVVTVAEIGSLCCLCLKCVCVVVLNVFFQFFIPVKCHTLKNRELINNHDLHAYTRIIL